MRALAKSLLVIALLAAVPAFAQSQPPARVGRVSLVSGTLAFYGPGDAEWSAAHVNQPVAAGGWFASDPQSRAELRIGPNSINLSNDTQINFADLQDNAMQIALTQGRVGLHLRQPAWRKDETIEIDVPRGVVWLSRIGVYDIAAGSPDQPTRIMVFAGSAQFVGGGVDMTVKPGEQLLISGTDTLSAATEPAAPDDFVEWCRAHDYPDNRVAAARHVSPAMTGFEELEAYGAWNNAPDYGAVWYPNSLPADWAPYREGHWVWIEPWGWNWVDDAPWGFAPFHYGRWAWIAERWAWVPGDFAADPVYAPALVAFLPPEAIEGAFADSGPPIGWFPLAPGEVFWPSYTRDPTYIRRVNITNVGKARLASVTSAIVTRPGRAGPPPQVINQRFANRQTATVVPARAFINSSRVAAAAIAVQRPMLQRAAVSVTAPPVVARPAGTATAAAPTTGRAPTAHSTAAALPPATGPNFSQLAPAPRVGQAAAEKTQPAPAPSPATQAPTAPATPPAATPGRPPSPPAAASTPAAPAGPPVATPVRPPGPPDFSNLAPARVGPLGPGQRAQQPAQAGPPGAPPGSPAAPPRPQQPPALTAPSNVHAGPRAAPTGSVAAPSGAHATPPERHQPAQVGPTPPTPASSAHANPPEHRQPAPAAPTPTTPNTSVPPSAARGAAPAPAAPDHAAQQRASQEQAQQRAAAQAQAAAAQQAAAQAAAAQQAQQRAAAQAQAAAAQQAQQPQHAVPQQRAAPQQPAAQHQQQARECGHPGQPACGK